MPYNRSTARSLLTAAEYDLFASSLDERMAEFGAAQLARRIARARRLRDKYQDLYRRQAVATRARTGTTRGTSGVANRRTAQKAAVFSELLARFEARLVRLNAALAREARRAEAERTRALRARQLAKARGKAKPVAKAAAAARAPVRRTAPGDYMSGQALAAKQRTTVKSPRTRAIQAHVRARGRRAQARRDSR